MAFTFVPNADGSFTEGDKQTNTDTGIEYVYRDGAWRALPSKIEDDFPTLDERYVNKSGDTMTGALQLEKTSLQFKKADGTNQLRIIPNDGSGTDYYTNIYSHNGGGMRFRAAPGNLSDNYGTGIIVENADHTINGVDYTVKTSILQLQTPTKDGHAANKWYVDDQNKLQVSKTGSEFQVMAPSLGLLGGPEATGSNLYLANNGFIRWGYGDFYTDGEKGGYIFMRDDTTFEIGTYNNVGAKIVSNEGVVLSAPVTENDHIATKKYVDDSIANDVDLSAYLPLTGGKMSGAITFSSSSTTRSYLNFDNDQKANQTSEIVIQRPYSQDNKVGDKNGTGGLNVKIMANSDQNRLNIMTGSGANTTTLRITGGGNGKQIHSFSSIELCGGDAARQTIWAKSGIIGSLSYANNTEGAQRLCWGQNKVWVKNATLDLTNNKIIQVASPDDDGDAANKSYVDTQIAANVSTGISVTRPPGLRFGFGNGTTAVGVGSFNYYSDSGQLKLRISLNGKDVKWYDGGKTQDYSYTNTQLFSIYYVPDLAQPSRWSIVRHGQFKRIDWHANDVLVWVDNHLTNGSLNTAFDYYIVLGGIF